MSSINENADNCANRIATCDSCDTFVALSDVTSGGNVIFGKNSDRPRGEVQEVIAFPREKHDKGELVQVLQLCGLNFICQAMFISSSNILIFTMSH